MRHRCTWSFANLVSRIVISVPYVQSLQCYAWSGYGRWEVSAGVLKKRLGWTGRDKSYLKHCFKLDVMPNSIQYNMNHLKCLLHCYSIKHQITFHLYIHLMPPSQLAHGKFYQTHARNSVPFLPLPLTTYTRTPCAASASSFPYLRPNHHHNNIIIYIK